jgi:hypothetical protein
MSYPRVPSAMPSQGTNELFLSFACRKALKKEKFLKNLLVDRRKVGFLPK